MYTAEQISELIQALRKCKEAACNSCKYECCQDITVDAADALTAITAENEALTHERDKLSKLLKAECAISNSHNDTIARLQAELAALRAKYEPVCPSCGLQNNRFIINRYCDRCGTNMTLPQMPQKEV